MKQKVEQIIKSIEKYDVVTFDVFDTLLKRDTCSFKDIVKLMDRKYQKSTGKKLPIWFYRERVHAPKVAAKRFNNPHVNIDEIYDVLHLDNKDMVKQLECETEIEYITRNKIMYEVYQYCLSSKKRVYAISDMYLPEKVLRSMLEKSGYEIEEIFVSCDWKNSKISGGLFECFMNSTHFKPEDIIHIGDNYEADVLGARKKGINSVKIERNDYYLRYTKNHGYKSSVDEKVLHKFISNRMKSLNNDIEKIGYEVLGPILYYYSTWLHDKLVSNKINDVYFCARDGYLFKEAYDYLYETDKHKSHYFFVSKKSVAAAYENPGEQRENLKKYMKHEKMKGTVAIADIGWSGRMHRMLAKLYEDKLYGFYMGTFSAFKKNVNDSISQGWLNISRYNLAKVYMNAGFIEILFSDTLNGRTLSYEDDGTEIKPIMSQCNLSGGVLRDLQKGALKFIKDYKNVAYKDICIESKCLIKPLLNFSVYPLDADVDFMSDELYGVEEGYKRLVEPAGDRGKLKGLQEACWKGGYLTKFYKREIFKRLYENINSFRLMFKV